MNKYFKYGLAVIVGVLVLLGTVAAYLAATFDPNDYKAQLVQLVKEKKQRSLLLDGDVRLTLFPRIGVELGPASLSERNSDQIFAQLDNAQISLALWPLLSRQIVVDAVQINGLKLGLIKTKDGQSNIDDLISQDLNATEEGKQSPADFSPNQFKLDIAAIVIQDSELSYQDQKNHSQYRLNQISLQTGRVVANSPIPVEMSGQLESDQPILNVGFELKTLISFDPLNTTYRLQDVTFAVSSHSSVDTSYKINLATKELTGDARGFHSDAINLELNLKQAQQAYQSTMASSIIGDMEKGQYSLPALVIAASATGANLPQESIKSDLKGNALLDTQKQSVNVELVGGVMQSQIKAKLGMNGFSNPYFNFELDVDKLDADAFVSKQDDIANKTHNPVTVQVGAQKPRGSDLDKLNLNGTLRIGALKLANVKLTQLQAQIKANKGVVYVTPFSAELYQGHVAGSMSVITNAVKPAFSSNLKLNGINIAPLLKDVVDFDMLEGRGNLLVNLVTQGNSVQDMKQGLAGNLSVNLVDGAVKGINIARTLREIGRLGGTHSRSAISDEKTDFSELNASFKVTNGVARNEDLMLKSPLLRISGAGEIDLANDRLDYLAKATLTTSLEGQGGKDAVAGFTVPVRAKGPYADLKYTLDLNAMLSDAAKQKLENKKEEVKSKLIEQIKEGGLKGLFK